MEVRRKLLAARLVRVLLEVRTRQARLAVDKRLGRFDNLVAGGVVVLSKVRERLVPVGDALRVRLVAQLAA